MEAGERRVSGERVADRWGQVVEVVLDVQGVATGSRRIVVVVGPRDAGAVTARGAVVTAAAEGSDILERQGRRRHLVHQVQRLQVLGIQVVLEGNSLAAEGRLLHRRRRAGGRGLGVGRWTLRAPPAAADVGWQLPLLRGIRPRVAQGVNITEGGWRSRVTW